jgi:hypothetical protein
MASAASPSSSSPILPVNQQVFQFKVTLKYTKPPIWRRIQVPATYNFRQLHNAIQAAMGWAGYHLHNFQIGTGANGTRIGTKHSEGIIHNTVS